MVAISSGFRGTVTRDTEGKPPLSPTTAQGASPSPANSASATKIDLSDRAKSIIAKAQADLHAASDITLSFDEILNKRTEALGERLSKIFGNLNVPPEYATHLKVDKFGTVTAEGPWKAKIEKMFSENPDLAKELKEVSGLSALKAAQASLDLYTEQKKATTDEKKQAEAWKNYNIRALNIQTLSGVMTMKDGKLRSAAIDYMDMIADPTGINSGKSRQDVADRLA
ncbi:MAG: hypothetical protein CFE29_18220 [Bradyrhizobiaceae bacterium PARB1]|jgi:hypothetical protein|nr:MAG: hypothetical protein CFE29_18220 [Bradyrhizobiaceae bacterium PARB1]